LEDLDINNGKDGNKEKGGKMVDRKQKEGMEKS
jgi:hypothetical protein